GPTQLLHVSHWCSAGHHLMFVSGPCDNRYPALGRSVVGVGWRRRHMWASLDFWLTSGTPISIPGPQSYAAAAALAHNRLLQLPVLRLASKGCLPSAVAFAATGSHSESQLASEQLPEQAGSNAGSRQQGCRAEGNTPHHFVLPPTPLHPTPDSRLASEQLPGAGKRPRWQQAALLAGWRRNLSEQLPSRKR
ncbi:unnamed protein product, partial [Closterium sp. Naga37s-1]